MSKSRSKRNAPIPTTPAADEALQKPQRKQAGFSVESLEPRILLSATWTDADTHEQQGGATDGDDAFNGDGAADVADGGAGNDLLDGNGGDDVLYGGAGDDVLRGDGGADQLFGGDGLDSLRGGSGDDLLSGNAGDDAIRGGTGADAIEGGDGSDVIRGDSGDDRIAGDAGSDTIRGGSGADTVSGGADHDVIYGDGGNDQLTGDAGNDTIRGGSGADTISGGADHDVIFGDSGNDNLAGDAGNDTIRGGSGNDQLAGNAGDDTLRGESGNDVLLGGTGNDVLRGGDGSDELDGGGGHDTLYGDKGDDAFSFHDAQDGDIYRVSGGAGSDTIDLSDVHSSHVSISDGRLDVHADDGTNFSIHHSQIESVHFSDGVVIVPTHASNSAMLAAAQAHEVEQAIASEHAENPPSDGGDPTSGDGGVANHDTLASAPVADAGADQYVHEGSTVALSAGGSHDADVDDTLSYEWRQVGGPAVALSDVHGAAPTFTAPDTTGISKLTFEVLVTDASGATHVDTVEIAVGDPQVESFVHGLSYTQFRDLTAEQVDYLTPAQVATIPNSDWFATMSAEARASLDEAQVQALNTASVSIGHLTAEQRDWLTPDQIQDLGYTQFRYLDAEGVDHLTPAQVATIPNSDWFATMSAEARASLDEAQVQALNTASVSIGHLTAEQRDWLTPDQIQDLGYTQFRYVPADRMADLTMTQIASIPNSSWFNTLSADQKEGLTHEQIRSLGAGLTGVTFVGGPSDDTLSGNSNVNNMIGGAGDDALSGSAGKDVLDGGAGSDTLDGGTGNDLLVGGGGNDQMRGGFGDDVFRFENARDGDVYTVDGGDDRDMIDLSAYPPESVHVSPGSIVVDLAEGGSFTINHTNIESVQLDDGQHAVSYNLPDEGGAADVPPDDSQPTDATPNDSGPTDVGNEDEGTSDAGPQGGGTTDVTPHDGGTTDVTPDAGAAPDDSGPTDVGNEDEGTSDAGPQDGGTTDVTPDAGATPDDAGSQSPHDAAPESPDVPGEPSAPAPGGPTSQADATPSGTPTAPASTPTIVPAATDTPWNQALSDAAPAGAGAGGSAGEVAAQRMTRFSAEGIAAAGASQSPSAGSSAQSDWDGSEELRVLDPSADADETELVEHARQPIGTFEHAPNLSEPAPRGSGVFIETQAIELPTRPAEVVFALPAEAVGQAFEQVFEASETDVVLGARRGRGEAGEPGAAMAASGDESREEAVSVGQPAAGGAVERSGGLLAQLWGLLRGLAGTARPSSSEESERERRR